MTYKVAFRARAHKDFLALDAAVRRRVSALIDNLAEDPRPPGIKPVIGVPGAFRVRAGDYRVVYEVDDERLIVHVVKVGHRRDVYDR